MPPSNARPHQSDSARAGTWWQRVLIAFFGVLFAVLCYWALGYVLQDIGTLPGPNAQRLVTDRLDAALRDRAAQLTADLEATKREIANQERRRQQLRESTSTFQTTLGQLLQLQRMSLEQGTALPEPQQQAFADSQQLFLDNQRREQAVNETLSSLQDKLAALGDESRQTEEAIAEARRPLVEEFERAMRSHRLRLAGLKVGVLAPLLLLAAFLFTRFRSSAYAPMTYAFGAAALARVFVVMHEYFPKEYFRYILIGTALVAVAGLLAKLLQLVARPGRDALLRHRREAYEGFRCPVCDYPIRRGPLRFMAWTPRSLAKTTTPVANAPDEPYTCPACATPLFSPCGSCGGVRHSLLPACDHCGSVTPSVG